MFLIIEWIIGQFLKMDLLALLFVYTLIIGAFALVAYFTIKKAVKDAIKEIDRERKNN